MFILLGMKTTKLRHPYFFHFQSFFRLLNMTPFGKMKLIENTFRIGNIFYNKSSPLTTIKRLFFKHFFQSYQFRHKGYLHIVKLQSFQFQQQFLCDSRFILLGYTFCEPPTGIRRQFRQQYHLKAEFSHIMKYQRRQYQSVFFMQQYIPLFALAACDIQPPCLQEQRDIFPTTPLPIFFFVRHVNS